MGGIDDYKRRGNIKGMEKLIEYLLCEDKKEYFLRDYERKKEYLLHEDKDNKNSLIWIHGEPMSDCDAI
jgi:hypothetical protein